MTIRQSKQFGPRHLFFAMLILLGWTTSCSLENFDRLGPGKSNAGGDAGKGGEATEGGAADGGSNATSSVGAGGSSGQTGQTGQNGGTAGMSMTSGGTTSSSGGAGGASTDPRCPAYTPADGGMLIPPSTNFEADATWDTVSGQVCQRTESTGSTDGCDGSYYLTCGTRKAAFDGPRFPVLPGNLANGRRYAATALARYAPGSAPSSASPLVMTAAWKCQTGTQQLTTLGSVQYVTSEWVRVGGVMTFDCTSIASVPFSLYFYVETPTAASPFNALEVDDFRVFEFAD